MFSHKTLSPVLAHVTLEHFWQVLPVGVAEVSSDVGFRLLVTLLYVLEEDVRARRFKLAVGANERLPGANVIKLFKLLGFVTDAPGNWVVVPSNLLQSTLGLTLNISGLLQIKCSCLFAALVTNEESSKTLTPGANVIKIISFITDTRGNPLQLYLFALLATFEYT